jgi:hypothetical protein
MFVNKTMPKNVCGGVIADKPSRDFTHPLGMPRGLKGLLYMLNVIVSPRIADLCFLLSFSFHFVLLGINKM